MSTHLSRYFRQRRESNCIGFGELARRCGYIDISKGANRIQQFEANNVPVDMYGVGSSLLQSTSDTSTDYTMDIVRVKLAGQWVDMAKLGRKANDNPELRPVDLNLFV